MKSKKRIPISAASRIARDYGYDQVVIIARKVGEDGGEHITTYGVNRAHCASAALQGKALKKFMGWPSEEPIKDVELDTIGLHSMVEGNR